MFVKKIDPLLVNEIKSRFLKKKKHNFNNKKPNQSATQLSTCGAQSLEKHIRLRLIRWEAEWNRSLPMQERGKRKREKKEATNKRSCDIATKAPKWYLWIRDYYGILLKHRSQQQQQHRTSERTRLFTFFASYVQ